MTLNFNTFERTWIVAEIGVNHEGDEAVALDLIDKAAAAGADAVKFQTFEVEHYISTEQPERFERTKGFQLSRDAFRRLKARADERGMTFFSTPFGLADVNFLDGICPVLKISSGDLTFLDLIGAAAATGKPLIISTGLGTHEEIAAAVERIFSVRPSARNDGSLILMHCIAAYPAERDDANLRNISWLRETFDLPVGYSDHTLGTKACELAVAAGAQVLEKHFTYRKEDQAFHDHLLSADPDDMAELIAAVRQAEAYLGRYERRRGDAEAANADNMRRAIGAVANIDAGETIRHEHLTWLRPAWGLGPDEMDSVIGKTAARPIKRGELIRAEDLS